MLVRIDVDAKKIVEQGEDYIVVKISDMVFQNSSFGCKIRTAKGSDPKCFSNGDPNDDIKKAKGVYIGVNGGISVE